MCFGMDVNVLCVESICVAALLLTLVRATGGRVDDFYEMELEDYFPTLFRRDHREYFVSVDHRHIYCDCRSFVWFIILTISK